jgi:flavin-dependent dehydrogenase
METHEVIVVGARCAGAATARLLALQGHDVVLVDRASFPSDTLSTHAISRGGVVQLRRWGLLDDVLATDAPAVRDLAFHVEGETLNKSVRPKAGVDFLVAPRRLILDQILLDAAVAAGVEVRTGIAVTDVLRNADGRVEGVRGYNAADEPMVLRADYVVGADGVRSRIARAVGAEETQSRPSTAATHYTYYTGLGCDRFEFHLGDGAFAGVFPTNGGEACVWIVAPAMKVYRVRGAQRDIAFGEILSRTAPTLAPRLEAATRTAPIRGTTGLPNVVRRPWGPGWALVGDAGYHRDPISGHGITDAFRDAELLARALGGVLRGETSAPTALAGYERTRDDLIAEVFDATCRMAAFPSPVEFTAEHLRAGRAMEREAEYLATLGPVDEIRPRIAA